MNGVNKYHKLNSCQMKIEYRNAYVCSKCRYVTLTVHVHEGVTPMLIACKNPTRCDGIATSFMYQLPACLAIGVTNDSLEPTHEWYKPDTRQLKKGGVLLRPRTDAKPILKDLNSIK